MFRFLNFKVYQLAKSLHSKLIVMSRRISGNHSYLRDQLLRASLSIVLNIAEGSGKGSDKDFNRYILTAIGSVCEVVASLDISYSMGFISKAEFEDLSKLCDDLRNQLGGFSKKLKAVG